MKRDISRFVRPEFYGLYGIRWIFDVRRMLRAGLLAEELAGARKLSAMLKCRRKA